MNIFTFTGRMGGNAELRTTPAGKSVCQFSVAVDSGFGDKKATNWVRCTLWEKRGEALAPYLLKGDMVSVSGELRLHEYEIKGEKRASLEVNVREVTLCGGSAKPNNALDNAIPANAVSQPEIGFDDLDIPFSNFTLKEHWS